MTANFKWLWLGILLCPLAASGQVSFSKDVAPVLVAKCQTCHGAEKAKGKFQLHTFELMMKPGSSGDAPVVAGKPEESLLYQLLIEKDPDNRMPQKDDSLPAAQVGMIATWIREGATFDGPDRKAALASLVPKAPHPQPPERYPFPVAVTALAFHPDGKALAVSGYHEVTFWDPASGNLLRRVKDLPRQVQGLAFSPDGSVLAAAGGAGGLSGELVLIDPTANTVKQTLLTLGDVLMCVTFSPDGRRLAAGGADNAIHIFSLPEGKEITTIRQHADWVMGLDFSPDGRHVASASRDRTARIYNVENGELEATYAGHTAFVDTVAYSADGKLVYSAGRDRKVGVWKAEDGSKSATIDDFDGEILHLLLHGDLLASACADHRVRLHKVDDRSLVRTLEGHTDWVYSLAWHAGSQRLAAGSYSGEVRVWKVEDGSLATAFTAAPGAVAAAK